MDGNGANEGSGVAGDGADVQASGPWSPTHSLAGGDFLSDAELIAVILAANATVDAGGWKWNQNGEFPTSLEGGAAGIGMFFLNLYSKTHNKTYLGYAENVSRWLNSSKVKRSPGNFTTTDAADNFQSYYGYDVGIAGIADFFSELYRYSGNASYLQVAEEAYNFLDSNQVLDVANGYSKFPIMKSLNSPGMRNHEPTSYTILEGAYSSGNLASLTSNDGNNLVISSQPHVPLVMNYYNSTNPGEIRLASTSHAQAEAKNYVFQTFFTHDYPIDLSTNGVSVRLKKDGPIQNSYLRAAIYTWSDGVGTIVGGWSDSVLGSSLSTSYANVTFSWSSNAPFINGSSPHGYVLVLQAVDQDSELTDNTFYLSVNSVDTFPDGRFYYSTTGSFSAGTFYTNRRDLVFNITGKQYNVASVQFETNLQSLGITDFSFSSQFDSFLKNYTAILEASNSFGGLDYTNIFMEKQRDNTVERDSAWINFTSATITGAPTEFRKEVTTDPTDYLPYSLNESSTINLTILTADDTNAHNLVVDYLQTYLDFDDRIYSYNLHEGNAGIGKFLVHLYEVTGNATYLQNAYNLTLFLDDNNGGTAPTSAYWTEKVYSATTDQVNFEATYLGYSYGAAGVGDFLLDYAKFNSTSSTAVDLLKGIIATLRGEKVTKYVTSLITGFEGSIGSAFPKTKGGADLYSGYSIGSAGIGDLLLKAGDFFKEPTAGQSVNRYVLDANRTAAFLTSSKWEYESSVLQYASESSQLLYKSLDLQGGTDVKYAFDRGAAGIALFLDHVVAHSQSTEFSRAMVGLVEWMVSQATWSNLTSGKLGHGLKSGIAGIGMALLGIKTYGQTYTTPSFQKIDDNYDTISLGNQQGEFKMMTESGGAIYYYGLYYGGAGIGMSYINHYKWSTNNQYMIDAEEIGEKLRQQAYWNLSNTDDNIYCGLEHGVAGIGKFLIELSRATHENTGKYAAGAEAIAVWLADKSLNKTSNTWYWPEYYSQAGNPSSKTYNGYLKGTAGIVDFYLDLWALTGNSTYLTWAQYGGNQLVSKDVTVNGYQASWVSTVFSGENYYYTGIDLGTAGIGKVLLRLGTYLSQNSTFLSWANRAAAYLEAQYDGGSGMWPVSDNVAHGRGLCYATGTAGILDFYLDLYQATGNTTYEDRINTAKAILTSSGPYVESSSSGVRWRRDTASSLYYYGYSYGSAGIIDVLLRLSGAMGDSNAMSYATQGASYLVSVFPGSNLFPSDSSNNFHYTSFAEGTSGIADVLLKIPDFGSPSVSALSFSTPLVSVEYDDNLKVSFTASDAASGLSSVNFTYSVQHPGSSAVVTSTLLTSSTTSYSYTFSTESYGTVVKFYLVVTDKLGYYHLDDNNSNWYYFDVKDLQIPNYFQPNITDSEGGVRDLQYSDTGTVRIRVYEPSGASQLKYVNLTYTSKKYGIALTSEMQDETGTYFKVGTVESQGYKYGETFTYSIYLEDYAGNNVTITKSFSVADYRAPTPTGKPDINLNNWAYAYTDVAVAAVASDSEDGAGLDQDNGVFVLYSLDGGVTWKNKTLTYDSTSGKFKGTIPGQSPWTSQYPWTGKRVKYVFCARDRANNYVYWARDPTGKNEFGSYSTLDEIPVNTGPYFYDVRINWVMVFIIIGVIAGALIGIYFVYTRRGSYWDRMRRKAGSTARLITFKERILRFFYWIGEKLERLGTKLHGAGENFSSKWERLVDWYEEHVSETLRKTLRAILGVAGYGFTGYGLYLGTLSMDPSPMIPWLAGGLVLIFLTTGKRILTGLWHGVKTFGRAVWDFIMGVRGYHLALWVIISIMFIVLPIVQYIQEPPYPLGVLFLIDAGFVMFISGFVLFIIRLIFRIAYK
ncbi:MAG: lanthionine synthetase LanC family protein [Promethearchaeota archaeon]